MRNVKELISERRESELDLKTRRTYCTCLEIEKVLATQIPSDQDSPLTSSKTLRSTIVSRYETEEECKKARHKIKKQIREIRIRSKTARKRPPKVDSILKIEVRRRSNPMFKILSDLEK
jgi:methyltransferase-like protein